MLLQSSRVDRHLSSQILPRNCLASFLPSGKRALPAIGNPSACGQTNTREWDHQQPLVAMSDRLVGLFWGRNTFTDGRGGFYYTAKGQQMAIRPEHYGDIKLAADITDDLRQLTAAAAGSNGGGATLRQRQEGSSSVANRNGNGFVRLPSGARHRVVQEGTGRVPKASDTVKFDIIAWKDAFDGRDKAFDERREVDVCLIMLRLVSIE
ncbi:unnamed protein product [Vitrella brassicaformis CCMP3155]|uniref:Uncharacterized protein n=1 Tax=Vitrella brassicaformis (strain CCMP3155) TaxID=1169540 RepID=A0A0G4H596_VITBC|nr:unnamed protein product [Vitrella brassicaformis CCMP3155]|eukprot:CEM38796.1 unnamed protein product [Vitrella brassicaformis CCMP3155]